MRVYIRYLIQFIRLYIKDIFTKTLGQYFPKYPRVLNFNANDICNSHCVMCNIWKQEQAKELSPVELVKILRNKLYKKVEHVGITGGEPTLRPDLPELFSACIESLPRLQGLSMITNCINSEEVIKQINLISQICSKQYIEFAVMISLDGIGANHDIVRGTNGNFVSCEKVINYVKNYTNLNLSIGTTLVKSNAWEGNQILNYLKDNNLYGRFRIGEFIKRLYNLNNKSAIRNFTEDELFNLAMFFKKLQHEYENNPTVKRTYASIQGMLLGAKRKIGCPYQSEGLVLNSKGDIAYCAPKSDIIGNSLEARSNILYRRKLRERRRILKHDCKDCIHDYHANLTHGEYLEEKIALFWKNTISINNLERCQTIAKYLSSKKKNQTTVFIVGWYGTETVGDKAILASIVSYYRLSFPDCKVVIASLNPFYTERTLVELKIEAEIIDVYSVKFIAYSKISDFIVMGGGPLMDLEELVVPHISFLIGKKYKRTCHIFGCGIGPITSKYQELLIKILNNADILWLRDENSKNQVVNYTGRRDVKNVGDPAESYISKIHHTLKAHKNNTLACFLREWTKNYSQFEQDKFEQEKLEFEIGLSKLIKHKAQEHSIKRIVFYSMNNFYQGNDDRDFAYYFIRKYFSDSEYIVTYEKKISTIESIILAMKEASYNICMRFHSVLFANTIGVKYTAVDYTSGGKIKNYLRDKECLEKMMTISQVKSY